MPISRPLLIALIGAVLVGATVLLTRGGGDDAASSAATAADTLQVADAGGTEDAASAGTDGSPKPAADRGASAQGEDASRNGPDGSDDRRAGMPRKVEQALDRGRVVVVLLYQPGAADDEATLKQVQELESARERWDRSGKRSAVFTASLTDAADYLGVTGALGVSRAPAIVIIRPGGEVRLLEGYTDGRSLRQHLTDALR